jgi:endonuclease III related protein
MMNTRQRLTKIFHALLGAFGKRNWWPGDTPLEVVVGAVLTQNTAWKNVEKAIANMKSRGVLDLKSLYEVDEAILAEIIRSAGFFNVKARRLKNLVKVICEEFDGTLDNLVHIDTTQLRSLLLSVNGMGPETADSILLYALKRPVFVVDAYTKRFIANHGLHVKRTDYHGVQEFFRENLPEDLYLFNEYHALIVILCQTYCRKLPRCGECPLKNDLDENRMGD